MEVNASFQNVKHLQPDPFFESTPLSSRLSLSPPRVIDSLNSLFRCVRLASHPATIGFSDPSLFTCIEEFKTYIRARYAWNRIVRSDSIYGIEKSDELFGESVEGKYVEGRKEICYTQAEQSKTALSAAEDNLIERLKKRGVNGPPPVSELPEEENPNITCVRKVLAKRMGTEMIHKLPWVPSKAYMDQLENQHRLPSQLNEAIRVIMQKNSERLKKG